MDLDLVDLYLGVPLSLSATQPLLSISSAQEELGTNPSQPKIYHEYMKHPVYFTCLDEAEHDLVGLPRLRRLGLVAALHPRPDVAHPEGARRRPHIPAGGDILLPLALLLGLPRVVVVVVLVLWGAYLYDVRRGGDPQ